MITLNVLDVARAAKQAYLAGQLSAQRGVASDCFYRDEAGCPCAIGAALDDETAKAWDAIVSRGGTAIDDVYRAGLLKTDDLDALVAIQIEHDSWLNGVGGCEADFVEVLNKYLPEGERIRQ